MIVLPAIDIKDGNCVRLKKGDFSTAETVAGDFLETAVGFGDCGAEWIHMVDLDGAKQGRPVNKEIYHEVALKTDLKVELGGGIRNIDTVAEYLDLGISRVILGSAALKDPALVYAAVERFGSEKIAVGIDAVDGMVATEGWTESSQVSYIELAVKMAAEGVRYFIFTDISRDGMLSGVNAKQLEALAGSLGSDCNVIASGGVRTMEDISVCKKMGLYGVICGKSVYSGTLDLREAIEYAHDKDC